MKGYLTLENGGTFTGEMPDWQTEQFAGEVVFTTGMCGYYESLTDPSFSGQILVFTYPLIGNYGIANQEHWESDKIQVKGVVVSSCCTEWSHHRGYTSLLEWLKSCGIPILTGVDTRALTKQLRSVGTLQGVISLKAGAKPIASTKQHLVEQVSRKQKEVYGDGKLRVILVDCGIKQSMIKELQKFPVELVRVPFDYDYTDEPFDGVFYSNGPGDPEMCVDSIEIMRKAMKKKKPIYGVCLGNQLMALAAGAKTFKLPFGHRGQNQPCMQLETSKCFITSQNHGYAVDEKSLPNGWCVTFRNLNDGTVEGIAHETLPFAAVQFHPEAKPGPTDTNWFFARFYKCLQS